jgi:hypothetical protein
MMSELIKKVVQISFFGGAVRFFFPVFVLVIAMAGCATTDPNTQAIARERLLASAGFQIRPANTSKKLAHLKTLPQRKLFTHKDREGKVHWIYADAAYCECMYVGTEKTYQFFRKLAGLEYVTADQAIASEADAPADEAWDMWGMWRDHWAEP